MKRKTLTLAICFLALIAIVSVGFASWIITAPVKDQTQEGSITAEAVENNSYAITLTETGTDKIHFGDPSDADPFKGKYGWLTSNSSETESLEYDLKIEIDHYEYMASQVYLNLLSIETYHSEKAEAERNQPETANKNEYVDILSQYRYDATPDTSDDKVETALYKAMKDNYIAAPALIFNEGEEITYTKNFAVTKDEYFGLMVKVNGSETAKFMTVKDIKAQISPSNPIVPADATANTIASDGSVTGKVYTNVTIKFNWGSFFSFAEAKTHPTEIVDGQPKVMYKANTNLNPLVYYSFVEHSDTVATNAMTALEAIQAIATAKTNYKVVISDSQK